MAARAAIDLTKCDIRPGFVLAANTVRKGFPVKINSFNADGTPIYVEAAAVGDNIAGIAIDAGIAGAKIRVAKPGQGRVEALVGTGGATAGAPAKFVADGLTNATVGGATTKLVVAGQWEETGVVGDLAALNLGAFAFTVGS
jgi:hypothetical protein